MSSDPMKDRILELGRDAMRSRTNSAEFLWVCQGVKPPLLVDPPKAPETVAGIGVALRATELSAARPARPTNWREKAERERTRRK